MSAIVVTSSVSIRVATMADLPFMDALQKQHSKQLGYFPTKQFEGYIEQGAVLIAEDPSTELRAGYCISRDRYLKRDELGVIYQLCVVPGEQRKLVGASLMKEVFARSAYGCKLYCCWCAQDIQANYFWESLGFIPIAFRAGSTGKKRVHIFWQRRINADDETTRYWYPSQTNSGAIREDRLVFPIPPGTHWTEVQAVALPQGSGVGGEPATSSVESGSENKALPPAKTRRSVAKRPVDEKLLRDTTVCRGMRFGPPTLPAIEKVKSEPHRQSSGQAKPKTKIDPKFVRAARELRDRYLERVNERPYLLSQGKYDVSRTQSAESGGAKLSSPMQTHLLPAA